MTWHAVLRRLISNSPKHHMQHSPRPTSGGPSKSHAALCRPTSPGPPGPSTKMSCRSWVTPDPHAATISCTTSQS
eukprot:441869-Pelagomonas_calceolata.AAC.1